MKNKMKNTSSKVMPGEFYFVSDAILIVIGVDNDNVTYSLVSLWDTFDIFEYRSLKTNLSDHLLLNTFLEI
jgi:hypothetical protein